MAGFGTGHDCSRGHRPDEPKGILEAKIDRNVARDLDRSRPVRTGGKCFVVWNETLKRDAEALSARLRSFLG